MSQQTIRTNTPGGVVKQSGYIPQEGEIFKLDDWTVGRINKGQLEQIDPGKFYMEKYGVNTGTDLEGTRRLGISGLGAQGLFDAFAKEVGLDINNVNKADRGFLASAGIGRSPQYVSGTEFDFSSLTTPGEDRTGWQELGTRDYNEQERQDIFGGNQPNFKPQGEFSAVMGTSVDRPVYGQELNVNGQRISTADPNYDEYARQLKAVGTPGVPLEEKMPETFGRYLGPTEFDGLRKEWTKAFNDAGIRDINVINNAIEKEFLKRNGRDIYLNTGARSIDDVIKDTRIRTESANRIGQATNPQNTGNQNVIDVSTIRADLPDPLRTPFVRETAGPDALTGLANNIADSTMKGIFEFSEKQRKIAEQKRMDAEFNREQALQGVEGLARSNYLEEKTEAALEEAKIKDTMSKLEKVGEDMAAIKESMMLGVSQVGDTTLPLTLMTREQRLLQEQGLARLSALDVIAKTYQNNASLGLQVADRTIDAINRDRQIQINSLNTLLEVANSDVIRLSNDEKEYAERQINILADEVEQTRKNKDIITEMLLTYPEAAQQGGVTLLDTPEQAAAKISKAITELAPKGPTIKEQLDARDAGFVIDDNGNLVPIENSIPEYSNVETAVGNGVITGYGSPLWAHGLDIQLAGGKGAEIRLPFDFEVIETGVNGGFGNQVKIRTMGGREMWLSHLDRIDVAPGSYQRGTVIGTQGNSGDTLGPTGVHVDISMPKGDGTYYTPQEVASFLGTRLQGESSGDEVQNSTAIQALKNAIDSAGIKFTGAQRDNIPMQFEGYVERGDLTGAADFVLRTARAMAPAEMQKNVMGREEALLALDNIRNLLDAYEAGGGNTGFFTGSLENIAKKIGKTSDTRVAELETSIRLAIMDYRKAVSGAAFTESEAKEYERLFPSIGKVKGLNDANIDTLYTTFDRNQDVFYKQMLGENNYNIIEEQITGLKDLSSGSIIEKNGVRYRMLPGGNYEQMD